MPRTFNCHKCDLSFSKKSNWERHFKNVHDRIDTTYQCPSEAPREKAAGEGQSGIDKRSPA